MAQIAVENYMVMSLAPGHIFFHSHDPSCNRKALQKTKAELITEQEVGPCFGRRYGLALLATSTDICIPHLPRPDSAMQRMQRHSCAK